MTFRVPEVFRLRTGHLATRPGMLAGMFHIPRRGLAIPLRAIAHDGRDDTGLAPQDLLGWEHVSVSLPDRCPTWEEMCSVKALFWDAEDAVMQLHPPASDYVNQHPYCLHLWRPIDGIAHLPPAILVGKR